MEKPSNEAGDMVKGGEELGDFKEKLEQNKEAKTSKEKKFSLVKDVFLDWSLRADINAYGKVFDYKNKFIRVIWSFIFTSLTVLTILVCVSLLLEYLTYDVVTKTNVFYERPIKFPAVTLCDNDEFTTRFAEDFIMNISKSRNLSIDNQNDLQSIITLAQFIAASPAFGDEARKKLGNFGLLFRLAKSIYYLSFESYRF
jgi:hypothetical protein